MAQRLHRRLHQSRGDARAERWQGNGIGVRVKGGRASARGRVSAATGHRERYIVTLCGSEGSHIRHSDERWRGAVSRSRLGCHVTARSLRVKKQKRRHCAYSPVYTVQARNFALRGIGSYRTSLPKSCPPAPPRARPPLQSCTRTRSPHDLTADIPHADKRISAGAVPCKEDTIHRRSCRHIYPVAFSRRVAARSMRDDFVLPILSREHGMLRRKQKPGPS